MKKSGTESLAVNTETPAPFQLPPMAWPVERARRDGWYFYQPVVRHGTTASRVESEEFGEMLMFGSYSYLGLLGHPHIEEAAIDAIRRFSTGSHGVRLLAGSLPIHAELEQAIAGFKGCEAAAVFSSGFLANLSAITALVGRGDLVFTDKLDHASIIDGCRLSGATVVRLQHNDMGDLELKLSQADPTRNRLVIADAVFSMDGDVYDLPSASRICRRHGALLMLDEAHSIGVLGRTGRGIEEHFGLGPDAYDIKMGTSLPAAQAGAALGALEVMADETWRYEALRGNIEEFRYQLLNEGVACAGGPTPIMPVICGDNDTAFAVAHECQLRGVFVQAIPAPVVPSGTARLRCCVTAVQTSGELQRGARVIADACRKLDAVAVRQAGEVFHG